jgi:TctA family transporter
MIKSNGHFMAFFDRPIAGTLGAVTLAIWIVPFVVRGVRRRRLSARSAEQRS